MLKLRKAARSRDVTVVVKDAEGALTRGLKVAFAIALTIHLVLFFTFHITKIHFNFSDVLLPPSTVTAEPSFPNAATIISTDVHILLDKRIPIPPELLPPMGSTNVFAQNNTIALAEPEPIQEVLPVWPPLLSTNLTAPPPIRVITSGNIHDILLADANIAKVPRPKLTQKSLDMESARVVFDVAVDTRDGTIFWYEVQEKSSIPALDALAEELLHKMQFTTTDDSSTLLAKGTIEVHYNLNRWNQKEPTP